jgi:hypothetical protein
MTRSGRASSRAARLSRIHTHDTFKGQQELGVPISDPRSHASLALAFLEEFTGETILSPMVQLHDVPYAVHRRLVERGKVDSERLEKLFESIQDWDTFTAFLLIDNVAVGTVSNSGVSEGGVIHWFLNQIETQPYISLRFAPNALLRTIQGGS